MSKPTPEQWAVYKHAFERFQYQCENANSEYSIKDCHEAAMGVLAASDPDHCYCCDRPKADCCCWACELAEADKERYYNSLLEKGEL